MREQDRHVLAHFRDRVRGRATSGVRFTLRVSGGLPSERLDQEVVVEGRGLARVEMFDAREGPLRHRREESIDGAVAASLLSEFGERLDRLVPARDAAFVPDSLVGYATIEVDGERAELTFAPDEALLPRLREVPSVPLAELATRMLLAVQHAPVDEEA